MAETDEQLPKWSFKTVDKIIYRGTLGNTSWIVPAPCCCVRYFNDVSHLSGDKKYGHG